MNLLILIHVLLPIICDVVRSEPDSKFSVLLDVVVKVNTLMDEQSKMEKEYDRPRFKVYSDRPEGKNVRINKDETLKFGDVRENVNGCYNSNTSVFKAPVSGTYLFYIRQTEARRQGLKADIVRGNGEETIGHIGTYSADLTFEVYVVANLDADEDVWIKCAQNRCVGTGGFYLMFAGVLLQ